MIDETEGNILQIQRQKKKKNFYVKEKLTILTSNHQIIHNMVTNEGQKGEGIY